MVDHAKHLAHGTEDPQPRTPAISLLLAYAGMLPLAAGAFASWKSPAARRAIAPLTTGWAGAVLCFLAGVRRGLSFRQEGGPTLAQLASMMWLFVIGAGSLLAPRRLTALVLLLLGYGSAAMIDPIAAGRHEAPRYFARLRPVQMLVPIASLLLMMAAERDRNGEGQRE